MYIRITKYVLQFDPGIRLWSPMSTMNCKFTTLTFFDTGSCQKCSDYMNIIISEAQDVNENTLMFSKLLQWFWSVLKYMKNISNEDNEEKKDISPHWFAIFLSQCLQFKISNFCYNFVRFQYLRVYIKVSNFAIYFIALLFTKPKPNVYSLKSIMK